MSWAPKWMWGWPSPIVEAISGLVTVGLVLVAVWLCQWWWGLAIVATALSCIYEKYIDGNGWDLHDLAQREIAILLAIAFWAWLHR
jgi:hypothetical protein